MTLMPLAMRDWLPEDHLAWFVIDAVESLNTRALHARPCETPGRRPYLPEMMVMLLLYAYCCGIRSSRQIEASCFTDAAFRVICGGLFPDHTTIARFVAGHEQALEGLFVEGVRLCDAAGLVDLSVLALDGTKVAADASLQRNRDAEWIRREIAKVMAQTSQDASEPPAAARALPGIVPSARAIESGGGRLGRLQGALAQIEAEDAARAVEIEQRTQAAVQEAGEGRQLSGRKPKDPRALLARAEIDHRVAAGRLAGMRARLAARQAAQDRGETCLPAAEPPSVVKRAETGLQRAETTLAAARETVDNAQPSPRRANVTDPDSRIMSTKDGWVQGFNCQAIVNPNQIVLAVSVSQNTGDVELYQPMLTQLDRTLHAAGVTATAELMLADAGYCSEHNLTCPGSDRLIATQKDHKQRRAARELGRTNGPPPPGLNATEEMEHLLRTPQGAAAYKQRSCLIEPVFGDRKHNRHIRQFRRRGLDAVRSEWSFIQLAGNLTKLHRHLLTIAT
jgi:transposase